jgi:hypothetical protein
MGPSGGDPGKAKMTEPDWRTFLARWSQTALTSTALNRVLPAAIRKAGWLGSPGASEAELARAESRLGQALPPSYRAFLRVSNGWLVANHSVGRLLPASAIDWFAVRHPDWLEAWLAGYTLEGRPPPITDRVYLVYGLEQDPAMVRVDYLQAALALSDGGEAIYLLNPLVVDGQGEWEAWYFESELGASRYRSFWELMQAEYQVLLATIDDEQRGRPADDAGRLVARLPGLIAELQQKARPFAAGQPVGVAGQYQRGIADGLRYVEERLREIMTSSDVRRQLEALADELEQRVQVGARGSQSKGGMFQSLEQVQAMAAAEGYRQALGLIRWFLRGQD